jgi:toxin ParE1/3/4
MVKDVIWTQPAEDDLENIFNYYKKEASEDIAQEIVIKLLDALDIFLLPKIETSKIGQTEPSLEPFNQGHRYLVEGHYKIIYFIQDGYVYVTHAFDTRQDPNKKKR